MARLPEYLYMFVRLSERIPGWTRGPEAEELIRRCHDLPSDAVVVEIGAFLGSGTVLLAGARKMRGSGHVYSVDPFDASGDAYSVPHYQRIVADIERPTQREQFDENIRRAGLSQWATACHGTAESVAAGWHRPIDLLFMDGDQSPEGVRSAYLAWSRWLKPGAILALHNSNERTYDAGHDGHYLAKREFVVEPHYVDTVTVASTTFAVRTSTRPNGAIAV